MIYIYRCKEHGDFEELFYNGDFPREVECPKCGGLSPKVITASPFKINNEFFSMQSGQMVKNKHQEEDQLKMLDEQSLIEEEKDLAAAKA